MLVSGAIDAGRRVGTVRDPARLRRKRAILDTGRGSVWIAARRKDGKSSRTDRYANARSNADAGMGLAGLSLVGFVKVS